ncbi:hypothetical protein H4R33_005607 [Dimargaris cristalligena]|nr:hypothetical protein H4R33_005607 [Dimargaris cristalligena]
MPQEDNNASATPETQTQPVDPANQPSPPPVDSPGMALLTWLFSDDSAPCGRKVTKHLSNRDQLHLATTNKLLRPQVMKAYRFDN